MKRSLLVSSFLIFTFLGFSQGDKQPGVTPVYRGTAERINDLVHTKLDAKFDYQKQQLNGKTWITLKPHLYPTDSLRLDAKGMDIHEVALVKGAKNNPLKYNYDGLFLTINLDKTYRNTEAYTVNISYTA